MRTARPAGNAHRRILGATALALALTGCGQGEVAQDGPASAVAPLDGSPPAPQSTGTSAAEGGWTKAAAWPNVAWYNALTAWTDSEVLVFGGPVQRGGASGPAPDLQVGHAAGAYDPTTDRWRPISVTPFSQYRAQVVAVGETVYALAFGDLPSNAAQLWAYSAAADTWRPLAGPPLNTVTDLAVAGPTLVAWDRFPAKGEAAPVLLYDRGRDTWQTGPANPWKGYRARSIVGLPDGRIVTVEAPADAPSQPTSRQPSARWRAAVLDPGAQSWRPVPGSPVATGNITGNQTWVGVGGRVVNADSRSLPADAVSGTHAGPVPLGGILDVDSGRWEPLPELPGRPHEYRPGTKMDPPARAGWNTRDLLRVAGGDYAVAFGWAFNARQGTWTELTSIPADKAGLTDSTEVWAGDQLLFWANGKVNPTRAGDGYRIVATHVGWSWRPE